MKFETVLFTVAFLVLAVISYPRNDTGETTAAHPENNIAQARLSTDAGAKESDTPLEIADTDQEAQAPSVDR